MKKTSINVLWQCFGRHVFVISLLLAVLFTVCGNHQKAQETALFCDNWEYNDNETGYSYHLNLSSAGKIKLSVLSYYDVAAEYSGTYRKQSDGGDYAFTMKLTRSEKGAAAIDGRFAAMIDNDGLLHLTLKSDLEKLGNSGTEMVFYKPDADVPVKLPVIPNVLDFFTAAYPLTFNGQIRDAYYYVMLGRSGYDEGSDMNELQQKTVDLTNGYIEYMGGGAPSGMVECRYWKCCTGDCLFAINVLGESPEIQPTRWMWFFRFDITKRTMRPIDPPYVLQKPADGEWSLQLPRHGKDIKVIYLNEDYTEKSTAVLQWNGKKFKNEEFL